MRFKTLIGALKGGTVGRWRQHVEDNRGDSAMNATFDDSEERQVSVFLYSTLLGSTEDRAHSCRARRCRRRVRSLEDVAGSIRQTDEAEQGHENDRSPVF